VSEGAYPYETPAGSVTLVLIRHGESRWNAAGVLQGQQCNGLSALGLAQAEAVAEHLAKVHGDALLIARSDIERVAQTSAPTEERLGLPVVVDARLREVDLGEWSGLPRADVLADHRDELLGWLRCEDVRPGGGETLSEMRDRVWAGVTDIGAGLLADGGGTALVFTHGGPIRTGTAAVMGLDPGAERHLQPVRNGSLSLIRLDPDGTWRLIAYNRVDHLP
jgi:broad specificity phosphatase PhoE